MKVNIIKLKVFILWTSFKIRFTCNYIVFNSTIIFATIKFEETIVALKKEVKIWKKNIKYPMSSPWVCTQPIFNAIFLTPSQNFDCMTGVWLFISNMLKLILLSFKCLKNPLYKLYNPHKLKLIKITKFIILIYL